MMSKISLLDCTLRDGGYVNDWYFGKGTIDAVIQRLSYAGVDFIEVGFIDDRRLENMEYSIQPFARSYNDILGGIKKRCKYLAMIDYGTCSIDNICCCSETMLDGIRLIFKKEKMYGALEYAKLLKNKGYLVFLQMVSITSYSDDDILEFSRIVNELEPFAVSIVDTYGLMHKDQVLHYYDLLDQYLMKSISIGYHSHNNFQLAYSNTIELVSYVSERDLIVDGTLYGMGKSAGNAPIELIAMFLNENKNGYYDISQLLEAIDNNILPLYMEKPWGYSMLFYIAASNDCHPNYISYLLKKRALSVKSINEIASKIEEPYKLHYNEEYISKKYEEYQTCSVTNQSNTGELKEDMCGRKILVLGPGRSIVTQRTVINNFIKENNVVVIAANCVTDEYPLDYVLISNSKRYNILHEECSKYNDKLILTSNIVSFGEGCRYVLDYGKYTTALDNKRYETILAVILNLMRYVEPQKVYFAGFDGFDENLNYYTDCLNIGVIDNYKEVNEEMKKLIEQYQCIKCESITASKYWC